MTCCSAGSAPTGVCCSHDKTANDDREIVGVWALFSVVIVASNRHHFRMSSHSRFTRTHVNIVSELLIRAKNISFAANCRASNLNSYIAIMDGVIEQRLSSQSRKNIELWKWSQSIGTYEFITNKKRTSKYVAIERSHWLIQGVCTLQAF